MERGHELVGRVERQRRDARVLLAGQGRIDAALGGEDDERALGRVADQRAVLDLGVGAQRHRQQQRSSGTSGWPPTWVIWPSVE